ncbi:Ca-activated chloride channel family protein [Hymenobacter luteus]|uniref:Ca-activated chloride channel family protein n=2 Tax=Hymenobacter TaxID=89966 RepID=A0A7W9WAS3_9BACT|nr:MULTISPECIES: VWA domain-containing protein [Hymenobacter]MBB4599438.1 Ca-activated chloride channel family protein [Hymenobacter latericoloratus]MBB6058253.1 Ca-activated chloride channel family protein [Hymenobacter luteus]
MPRFLYCTLVAGVLTGSPAQAQQPAPARYHVQNPATQSFVEGQVIDARTKRGLPGVTVLVKGTRNGATTTSKGYFQLELKAEHRTLVFSSIGYVTRELTLRPGQTVVPTIALQPDRRQLSEVVVTGKAKPRATRPASPNSRRQQTETVAGNTDNPADLAGLEPGEGATSADYALQGRVAGVAISPSGGYMMPRPEPGAGETYASLAENGFHNAAKDPLSTFSIDVDAASYSNVRRFLQQGQLPPSDAVRTEELINYFQYDYPAPAPTSPEPFRVLTELAECPWNPEHQLVQVALQGRRVATEKLPPANLVFLVDVSGSMMGDDRLGLIQQSLRLLTNELRPQDKVALVVYAGAAGLVLPPTPGSRRADILAAIDQLQAGGSTAGGAGLRLAYQVARQSFNKEGNNRIILCTDGDFNVGEQSDAAMERLITQERETGVFLTVLGVGQGNYQDKKMELLADKGNGNYAYLDNLDEARRVLVRQFGGTLFTIAKDVKLQVEFNPARVREYRLVGYENRLLAAEDFNNDRKDAGELGAGHTVTALYEVVPVGARATVDPLKYQSVPAPKANASAELLTVKLRYKEPQGSKSQLLEQALIGAPRPLTEASENLRFAAAVAQFGMLLRQSDYRGAATWESTARLAEGARRFDPDGYRAELVRLVKLAEALRPAPVEVGAR